MTFVLYNQFHTVPTTLVIVIYSYQLSNNILGALDFTQNIYTGIFDINQIGNERFGSVRKYRIYLTRRVLCNS